MRWQRFVDLAPPDMRDVVQAAMAETFRGAVAQVLLKKTGGGRVAAREVLLGTASVTRLIADGQLAQLPLALESGRQHGMMPLTDALLATGSERRGGCARSLPQDPRSRSAARRTQARGHRYERGRDGWPREPVSGRARAAVLPTTSRSRRLR